jgi:hypothetical protein
MHNSNCSHWQPERGGLKPSACCQNQSHACIAGSPSALGAGSTSRRWKDGADVADMRLLVPFCPSLTAPLLLGGVPATAAVTRAAAGPWACRKQGESGWQKPVRRGLAQSGRLGTEPSIAIAGALRVAWRAWLRGTTCRNPGSTASEQHSIACCWPLRSPLAASPN